MAEKYDVGAKIGLEGEATFKSSIKEINAGLTLLSSELKLTQTQFEGQEKTLEALTRTHDVLERTLYTQRDKVVALEEAWRKSAETNGEANVNTMRLQKELNNASAEVLKTERQVEGLTKDMSELSKNENSSQKSAGFLESALARLTGQMKSTDTATGETAHAIKKVDDDSKGLGDTLNDVGGKFGVSLPPQISKTLNGLMKLDPVTLGVVGGFAALVTVIVDVEKKLFDLTKQQAAYADEILTMSSISGIDTKTLQEYQYAAELIDVSVDTLVGSQEKLIRNMSNAQRGVELQADAFKTLGVSYKNADGSLRDSQETFWDVIDALGKMENETDRDAVAMQILGRSARDLNPLIKAGSDQMKELGKEANSTGYVLDTKALNALGAVDDAMQRFNNTTEATKNQIAVEFAPHAEEALTKVTKLVGDLSKALKDSGIIDAFGMLLTSATDIIAPTEKFSGETIPKLTNALRPLATFLAFIADLCDYIAAIFKLDPFGGVKALWGVGYSYGNGNNRQTLREQWEQTDVNKATSSAGYGQYYADGKWYSNYDEYLRAQYNKSNYAGTFEAWKLTQGRNAAGTGNWRGGWTWVGENGPERVRLPQGSEILSASESRENSGGDTFYLEIHVDHIEEFETLVLMAKEARMRERKR